MSDTIAVITGASRGIGAALARGLLAPGVKLITLARRTDAASSPVALVGVFVHSVLKPSLQTWCDGK